MCAELLLCTGHALKEQTTLASIRAATRFPSQIFGRDIVPSSIFPRSCLLKPSSSCSVDCNPLTMIELVHIENNKRDTWECTFRIEIAEERIKALSDGPLSDVNDVTFFLLDLFYFCDKLYETVFRRSIMIKLIEISRELTERNSIIVLVQFSTLLLTKIMNTRIRK